MTKPKDIDSQKLAYIWKNHGEYNRYKHRLQSCAISDSNTTSVVCF